MRTFSIIPFQGATPLRFGMGITDTQAAVGRPLRLSTNWKKTIVGDLDDESLSLGFGGVGETLDHIGFSRNAHVAYGAIRFFEDRNSWRRLLDESHDYHTVLGFLVFCDIGIALSGFHDDYEDELAVTVFPKGHWEKYRPQFQPYEEKNKGA